MRQSRFALILGILLLISTVGLLSARYFKLHQKVNEMVFRRMKPYLGENVTLQAVNLRLTGMILNGLVYFDPRSGVTAELGEIRILFDPLNLLFYGFQPLNLIDEVSIREAKLYYFPPPDTLKKKPPELNFWNIPAKYPSVKKVTVQDGVVFFPYLKVEQVNFWLDLSVKQEAEFDVSAAAGCDDSNLRLKGKAYLQKKQAEADFSLYSLQLDSLSGLPEELKFARGVFSLDSKLSLQKENFRIEGSAVVDSLLLFYGEGIRYSSLESRLNFRGEEITIDSKGHFIGVPVNLQGTVKGFTAPEVELSAVSGNIDLADLADKFAPDFPLSGEAELRTRLTVSGGKIAVRFNLASPDAGYANITAEGLEAEGFYEEKQIRLSRLECQTLGGKLNAEGEVDLAAASPVVALNFAYGGKPDLSPFYRDADKISVDTLYLQGEVTGSADNPRVEADYIMEPGYDIARLRGTVEYFDKSVKVYEYSGAGDSLSAEIRFDRGEPVFTLSSTQMQRILPAEKLPKLLRGEASSVAIYAGGEFRKFYVFIGAELPGWGINIDAGLKLSGGGVDLTGNYRLFLQDTTQVVGEFDLRYAQDTLTIGNLSFGEQLYLIGGVDIPHRRLLNCRVRADDFPLDSLLLYAGEKRWREFGGKLKLDVKADGDWTAPEGEFSAYVSEGKLYNSTGYWANISGSMAGGTIKLSGIDFGDRGTLLAAGRGSCDLKSKEVDFRSSMEKVDFDLLVKSITGKAGMIRGSGGYTIHLGGSWENPVLEAGFRLGQGALKGIIFDRFTGAVKFDLSGGEPTLEIPSMFLTLDGKYTITSQGKLSLQGGEIDLNLSAEGNLPAILAGMTKEITRAEGSGKISLSVGGTADSIFVKSGQASLQGGLLEMKTVADKIEDIVLNAELKDNFIHIAGLSGKIDDVNFLIKTIREMSTADGKLEPLILGKSGISFGIIVLETGREGLKLHIPGISAAGETAKLSVTGRKEGEKAYLAGPLSRPKVRAKLLVRDGVIAYPLPKKPHPPNWKPSAITQFIYRIDWDMEIIPDRGNSYQRDMSGISGTQILKDISGLFSQMTVDLEVDRRLEGMTMRGAVKGDSSFIITGGFISSRGTINLLDLDFKVQEFKLEFGASDNIPWMEGYASATKKDSLGRDQTVVLRLATIDPVTGDKEYRGRWGDFTFVLENELGESQEQILTMLGYAPESLTDKAASLPLTAVDKAFFGAWLTRLEREIRNVLGVDYINIDPALAQNLLAEQFTASPADSAMIDWRTRYLRHSRVSVGKYITDDLFFTYTGSFETGESPLDHRERLGMIHTWNLEFRLPASGANLLMVVGYEYDNLELKSDKSVSIKYSFNF